MKAAHSARASRCYMPQLCWRGFASTFINANNPQPAGAAVIMIVRWATAACFAACIAFCKPAAADDGRMVALPTGVSLFVQTIGAGRPLLILHGGLGLDHTYFQPWLDPLRESFQVIYPDIRGNGRSEAGSDGDFTLDRIVDDLDALRISLGVRQWDVMGHSFGGFIAEMYALKHPGATAHLILVDTSPAPRLLPRAPVQDEMVRALTPGMADAVGKMSRVGRRMDPEGGDAELMSCWHTIMPAYFHDFPSELLVATDRTMFREHAFVLGTPLAGFDLRPELSTLRVPTLVAVGRYDAILPMSHSEAIASAVPGVQLVIFDRSGHFPFIEERDRFLETVRTFLGDR